VSTGTGAQALIDAITHSQWRITRLATWPVSDGKLTHVAMGWKELDAFHQVLEQRIAHYKARELPTR
jgi:hypothetical protein